MMGVEFGKRQVVTSVPPCLCGKSRLVPSARPRPGPPGGAPGRVEGGQHCDACQAQPDGPWTPKRKDSTLRDSASAAAIPIPIPSVTGVRINYGNEGHGNFNRCIADAQPDKVGLMQTKDRRS